MLHNVSPTAADEPWEGQAEKEKANSTIAIGAVKELKQALVARKDIRVLDIEEFSNQTVANIFNYIIRSCPKKK